LCKTILFSLTENNQAFCYLTIRELNFIYRLPTANSGHKTLKLGGRLMGMWSLDFISDMERMRREMDRFLDEFGTSSWTFPFSRTSFLPGRAARGYPLLNIGEDNKNIYVDALAPGVDPKTLDISVTQNQLVITGEKTALLSSVEAGAIHRSERSEGQFTRSMTLPFEVDSDKVKASYQDGLLKIILPKAEAAKPKQIQVSVT
jgi:HSP20 family protein